MYNKIYPIITMRNKRHSDAPTVIQSGKRHCGYPPIVIMRNKRHCGQ